MFKLKKLNFFKNFESLLWILSIVGSQFYVFKSGIPQPAHFFLFVLFIYYLFNEFSYICNFISNRLSWFAFFIFYIVCINLIYFTIEQEVSFLVSTSYILFGLFTLCSLFVFLEKYNGKPIIYLSLWLGLSLLFLISILKLGGFEFYPRYNAFFNDPNQMAFWVICIISSILMLDNGNEKFKYLAILISIYIIILSGSRSGLLGLLPILFYVILVNIKSKNLIFLIILSLISGFFIIKYYSDFEALTYLISRIDEVDSDQQLSDRGYTRIAKNLEYIIFGSGQGADFRFNSTHEIHSTWAGIFFYYGIFGLFIFILSLCQLSYNLSFRNLLLFIAPLLYGFSTFGLRTPVVWIFLAVSFYVSDSNSRKSTNFSRQKIGLNLYK